LNIKHPDEVLKLNLRPGDQVRVNISLTPDQVHRLSDIKEEIGKMIESFGCTLNMLDFVVEGDTKDSNEIELDTVSDEDLIKAYCSDSSLSELYLNTALRLLGELSWK
jgi:hypothetical protein